MAEIKKAGISEGGHHMTGKVAILYGTVKAISPDGTVRLLKINSPVFADDRIITGDDGSISIVFDTFPPTQLDLGRVSDVVIDEDVYGNVSPDVAAEASAEQKSIQEALLAGDQPLELDPTAAGVEANAGGGHSVFVVNPDWVHVTPESGAETEGITWGFATTQYAAAQEDNSSPSITVDPGNSGTGGIGDGADVVSESGLPAGSDAAAATEFAQGTFTVSDPDGLSDIQSVTINNTTIPVADLAGTVITGVSGKLTITSYNPSTGVGSYTYELTTSTTDGPGPETDIFTLKTTDGSGSSDEATITIEITDDVPQAVSDTQNVAEDAVDAITGNVLANDQSGADEPATFVNWSSIAANYGTFTDTGNGTYSYILNNANAAVQALENGETLQETFQYTMQDADGDTDTATLTITITGTNDVPKLTVDPLADGNPDTVYESGLPAGSNASASTEFAYGTFTVADGDGLDDIQSVTINGTPYAIGSLAGQVISGTYGTLTVTSYNSSTGVAQYAYKLTTATSGEGVTDSFSLTASDGTSSSTPAGAITISIVDDVPNAVNDSRTITEDTAAAITGNVFANDVHANGQPGADAASFDVWTGSTAGAYGTFVAGAGGAYSYTLDSGNAAVQGLDQGETLQESFTYRIKDADGDTDTATLTITITGTNDVPKLTVDPLADGNPDTVYESGLPAGSNASASTEFAYGTFTVADGDGLDDIQSVTINGTPYAIGSLAGQVISGTYGTLTVTSYNSSTGVAQYAYKLTTATSGEGVTDSFSLTASDGTSSSTPAGAITISIVDDVPNAVNDSRTITEDTAAAITGNVFANDVHANGQPGADAASFDVWTGSTAGAYGTFVAGAGGAYSYTLDSGNAAVQGLDQGETLQESFTYRIKDADGDTDTATLTITITGTNDVPKLTVDPLADGNPDTVYESGLPAGSNASASTEFAYGTFTVADGDGLDDIQSVTINGTPYAIGSLAGQVISGTYGTLTVTSYNSSTGVAQYAYKLTTATSGEGVTDSFSLTASDGTSSSTPAGAITISIVDDVPNAVNDSRTITEDTAAAITGNVFANDVHANGQPGADAASFDVWTGSTAGAYGTFVAGAGGAYSYTLDSGNAAVQGLDQGETLQESFTYRIKDADGDTDTATLTITITGTNDVPKLTVDPLADGNPDTVYESGLPAGSNASASTEFAYGTFTVADGDGLDDIQSVTINGTPYAIGSLAGQVISGTYGTLTVTSYNSSTGVAQYAYKLTTATSGEGVTDSFSLTASDGTSSSTPAGAITISIVDDVPNAYPNINSLVEGATITGNVLTDGTDDIFGADGAAATTPTGGVVGVKAGSDTTTPVTTGVGTVIHGAYGVLTLNADGSYTYDGTPDAISSAQSDVFVYTIQDGDGDFSTTTLTINLTDSGLIAPADNDALVYEKALDTTQDGSDLAASTYTGSIPGDSGETDAINQLNAGGGVGPYTYTLVGSATGNYGTIQINPDGSYVYTLTKPYDTAPDADNGMNTEENKDNFTYKVTDANGNTATGTITVDIVDDIPTALPQQYTIDVEQPITTAQISALASGWYAPYDGNVDNKINSDADPYYEKISWGDNSSSSSYVFVDNAALTDVNLGEKFTLGTFTHNNFPIPSGSSITSANLKVTFDVVIDGQTMHIDHTVQFQHNETPNDGANPDDIVTIINGTNIVDITVGEATYRLTIGFEDGGGNTVSQVYTDENATNTFNLNGTLALHSVVPVPDVTGTVDADFGADGPGALPIVSISHDVDGDGIDEVYNTSSAEYDGATTTLTLTTHEGGQFTMNFTTGDYTYTAPTGLDADTNEIFHYAIVDADGDTASSTLTMNLTAPLVAPADNDALVYEKALDTTQDGSDLAASTYTGSIPGDSGETDAINQLNAGGGVGPYTYTLVGSATGNYGTIQINPDGSYVYTLTKPYDTAPDADNGMNTEENKDNFTYKVTDANGNTATGTITVDIVDDIPTAGDQSVTVDAGTVVGTNLMLILDTTGSMSDPSGVAGKTRLDLAKDSLEKLIGEYEDNGPVMVKLVTFSETANTWGSTWMTADDAVNTINALSAGGRTNYDVAIQTAKTAFGHSGAISGAQNVSYFLSDGVPNEPYGSVGISATEQAGWETFLANNDITSFALGMGSGATTSTLAPVAYDGVNNLQIDPIVVTDMSQLDDVLLDTVIVPSTITGNLVAGSVPADFGADGPGVLKVVSIAHDANGDGNISSDEVYNTSSAGYDAGTTTLTLSTHEGGKLTVNFSTGDYTYTSPTTPALGTNEVFKYTIMDGDGDTATGALTVNLPVEDMLVVGTTANDQSGQTIDHYIDHNAPLAGVITGGGGNDILVGDTGGVSQGAGSTANIVFVLDRSGSMDTSISFGTGSISRLQALKNSMADALNDLYNSGAENVRVHLVSFSDSAKDLGTFNLTANGVDNATALAQAIAAVNGLSANGSTNYEAALKMANTWIGTSSNILASADVNEVIFVSDGAPNTPNSNISQYTDDANNILSHGFTIEAVGINVDTNALGYLDKVEGSAAAPGSADNIHTAEELTAVIGHLAGGDIMLNTAGNDNIVAGDGNDMIFGDALNTDALAHANSLTTPDGSGWEVFQQLGWTEQQIIDYVKANHASLSAESGRTGGNDIIDAGAGNDIVYGQEGNDILSGGAGNDILVGGSGNNTLAGGAGADTFTLTAQANDIVNDYSKTDGDKVDISSILDVADESVAKSYLGFHNNGDGKAVLEVYNSSTDHSAGNLISSVTFDNITDATNLDSLLGKVDVDHDA